LPPSASAAASWAARRAAARVGPRPARRRWPRRARRRPGHDERLARAIEALAEAQREVERRLEAALGEIAFAAVCRLAGEAAASRDWIHGSVAAICAELQGETRARVRLHPGDLAQLDPEGHGELRLAGLVLRLAGDEALTPGGCQVELELGGLDATLETRLARLRATLLAATEDGGP